MEHYRSDPLPLKRVSESIVIDNSNMIEHDNRVRINVYDLVINGKRLTKYLAFGSPHDFVFTSRLNNISLKVGFGGAFHSGVVVFGREISYGENGIYFIGLIVVSIC
jgi:hypothetical protein